MATWTVQLVNYLAGDPAHELKGPFQIAHAWPARVVLQILADGCPQDAQHLQIQVFLLEVKQTMVRT